jgi:hypothetical protein
MVEHTEASVQTAIATIETTVKFNSTVLSNYFMKPILAYLMKGYGKVNKNMIKQLIDYIKENDCR